MHFAKFSKAPPSLLSPLPPPQKCWEKISPPGSLIEDLRYYENFKFPFFCEKWPNLGIKTDGKIELQKFVENLLDKLRKSCMNGKQIVPQNASDCISAHVHLKNFRGEPDPPRKLVPFGHSGLSPKQ